MKKTMLSVAVLTGLFSFGASAADPAAGDIDTTSATLTWEAKVPTVVNGEWITITGQNGGALVDAGLTINPDGSFTSENVLVEVRYYDSATNVVGLPVVVGTETAASSGVAPESITYRVDVPAFVSEKGVDLSNVDVSVFKDDVVVATNSALKSTAADAWQTQWKIANAPGTGMSNVIAGDVITATTVLRADVEFAAYTTP
ncbi:conserved exported hypothetical protein [Vibrio owensii]|uniref:hypothetical protein n=1 Tax=Vibrio owensii TaxID=696485 RepID=UPI002895ECA4|nr:conserved exported hypothetical protein [Vibrio owensii]CAH1569111.1 conserved exported hypothetical protein [Vibrio owensii]